MVAVLADADSVSLVLAVDIERCHEGVAGHKGGEGEEGEEHVEAGEKK